MHVPFVVGRSNNAPAAVASSKSYLAAPDDHLDALSGEEITGLTCTGYDEKACRDPFAPIAQANHSGPKAAHAEQAASFAGKDGKFPGLIQALTDCGGSCGDQFMRSVGKASGPAGALAGYVSIGSSLATQELTIDDKGRLVSSATSELKNVSIGPKNEVHFSSLVTTAQALGAGPENSKDGRADVRITDFFILDNRVELTRAGLRLANGGPSEQEAYDGAKVLLKKLRDRGIRLELPNFDAQMAKTPAHVAVETQGLRVFFEQAVGSVQAGLASPLELGHATAVVAALDADRNINIDENPNGGVTVQTTAPTTAPPTATRPGQSTGGPPTAPTQKPGGTNSRPPGGSEKGTASTGTPSVSTPTPAAGTEAPVTTPSVEPGPSSGVTDPTALLEDPNQTALPSIGDVQNKLGLRDARSVSRAFGAFLGLGLILPLARFVIRRLG
jgi:hypothetical protein